MIKLIYSSVLLFFASVVFYMKVYYYHVAAYFIRFTLWRSLIDYKQNGKSCSILQALFGTEDEEINENVIACVFENKAESNLMQIICYKRKSGIKSDGN